MNYLEFLRQFKLAGYAIFDLAVSFIGIYFLSPLLSKWSLKIKLSVPKINWVFLTLPIGLLVHFLVGTQTPMLKDFIDLHGHYVLKLVILISLVLGLRNIKIVRNPKILAKE